jgi:hypothetical protein
MRVDLWCTSSYSYPRSNVAQTLCAGRRTLSSHVGQVHMRILVVGSLVVGAQHSFVLQKPPSPTDGRYSYSYIHRRTSEHRASGWWHTRSERRFPAGCWSPAKPPTASFCCAGREAGARMRAPARQQDESSSAPVLRLAAACLTSAAAV